MKSFLFMFRIIFVFNVRKLIAELINYFLIYLNLIKNKGDRIN